MRIERIVRNGKKIIEATIFGRMRYEAELTPMISSASICSVMRIVPISEAMLDPTLPARISATTADENSRIIVSRVAYPTSERGMNGESRLMHIWRVITAPMKTEMMAVSPIESTPSASIS